MLTAFNQFLEYVDLLPSPWNTIVKWVVGILLLAGFIFTNFKMVQHGTRAVKLRWGKAIQNKDGSAVEYKPGFPPKWVFPGVVKLISISILDRQVEVQMQVQVAEFYLFNVTAVLNFRVTDNVEKVAYVVEDLEPFLRGRGINALRESLTRLWYKGDRTISVGYVYHAQREFERIINPRVARVGVELESVDLTVTEDPQMATARALNRIGQAMESWTPKDARAVPMSALPISSDGLATFAHVTASLVAPPPGSWQEPVSTAIEYSPDREPSKKPRSLWHRKPVARI